MLSQYILRFLDLYYITPAQAKQTIDELFTSTAGESSYTPIQITEEATTRSIIVRGKEKDLRCS